MSGWGKVCGVVLALVLAGAAAVAAQADDGILSERDLKTYRQAFKALGANRWQEAQRIAARGKDPLPRKIIRWLDLRRGPSDYRFEDYASFIEANSDWPSLDLIRRHAERFITAETPDLVLRAWFRNNPPVTGRGAYHFARLLQANDDTAAAKRFVRAAWQALTFNTRDERDFLKTYGKWLSTADHIARLDRLLWDEHTRSAKRMLRRVPKGWQALAQARIVLMQLGPGVDWAIRRVPPELRQHAGLVYERVRWRRRKGRFDSARELLAKFSGDSVRPEAWWHERMILVRDSLAAGEVKAAYRIASHHGLTDGVEFAEAEFLSGWTALRFLHDPAAAFGHFNKLYRSVRTPISRARGAYWAGRAEQARGNAGEAAKWFRRAARHGTTYYGQLAATEIGDVPFMPAAERSAENLLQNFGHLELVRAVQVLHALGQTRRLEPFLRRLSALAETTHQHRLAAVLAHSVGRPDLAMAAARRAAWENKPLIDLAYPTIDLPQNRRVPEDALLYAMIRQESAFETEAVSHAGALGVMQLMPGTAKSVAREHNIRFSKKRLRSDPAYNISLGAAHLTSLLDEYRGSYVLAVAAYNAGKGRVADWIREFGDPRLPDTDVVDWVESIPYSETRNYVQRVLEALHPYRLRLSGSHNTASNLHIDLARGGAQPKAVQESAACGGRDNSHAGVIAC